LQRTIGDQAVQRLVATGRQASSDAPATTRFAHDFSRISVHSKTLSSSQPKLTVNTPGDIYEREAEAIADKVTRMSGNQSPPLSHSQLPKAPLSEIPAPIVQAKSEGGPAVSNTLSEQITSSRGSGAEMDRTTQAFMQSRFGADFSHVRIHTDGEAVRIARELNAQAFTVGRDIHFDSGKYSPGTDGGRHLLAHELTHTIQQGGPRTIQRRTEPNRQTVEGLNMIPVEEKPLARELGPEIEPQIQRSSTWAGATVHESLNLAEIVLGGDSPTTWQMLNGTMLKTEADADSSIKLPTLKTSGSGKDWKAIVETVPAQTGGDDETVLAKGPWTKVATKAAVGALTGLGACSGAGNSTLSAKGDPSDEAVFKANRRHEDHHVADDKVAFENTVATWDKKVEEAKSKGTEFKGGSADAAKAASWTAMGGTPQKIARDYRDLSFTKGGQFHDTPQGGPMSDSHPASSADCSTASVKVTNPS
jgi:hypothetical protein